MTVDMKPVASSHIAAIGHDPEADELHVEFRSGGRYVYSGVTAAKHAALLAAPSVGEHLHRNIRPHHPHRK